MPSPASSNKTRRASAALDGFPVYTLALAATLSLAFCIGLAWHSWNAFHDLQTAAFELVEMEGLRGRIAHRNETMEMTVRMAATTGDEAWIRRYNRLLPQLEQAIEDARRKAERADIATAVEATQKANEWRRELDWRIANLLSAGRREQAYAVLQSPDYQQAQGSYREAESGLLSSIRRGLDDVTSRSNRQLTISLLAGLIVPVLLVLLWWQANQRVRNWQRQVLRQEKLREAAEMQLQELNQELGLRVEARARQLRESEHRLSTVVDSAPVALFSVAPDGRIILSEGAALQDTHLESDQAVGRSFIELYADNKPLLQDFEKALAGEATQGVYPLGNGVFEIRLSPVTNQDNQVESLIGVATDVSEKHAAEQNYRMLANAVEQNPAGIAIMDAQGVITYVNEPAVKLINKSARELIGKDWRALRLQGTSERQSAKLREILTRKESWKSEFRMLRDAENPIWLRAQLSPIANAEGEFAYFLYTLEDISDRKHYQRSIEHQRHYDSLTGLPNRTLADKRIDSVLAKNRNGTRNSAAVMLLDLDDFKHINDLADHRTGDMLLIEAALRISACLRASETVARTGGDEFLILLNRFQGQEYVEQVASRVLDNLQRSFEIAGQEYFLSASIGVAMAPSDGVDARELTRKAETAMYQAKAAGKRTYRYFHPEMNVSAQRRMLVDTELHRAIERKELELYFQPIVDLGSGDVVAAEALLRWHNPTLSPIGPDEFIRVAEGSALINEIGAWVLEQACQQAVKWRGLAGRESSLRVAINVSSKQFGEADFATLVLETLRRTKARPYEISLEVTESLLIENPPVVAENLSTLSAHGIEISVDDFGTGYSSLGYLKHFSFSTLKIDRLFVRDVIEDRNDAELAAGIIALGHGLHMKVTGEGVETPAQLRFLHGQHCDQAQGFLFGKPMPAAAFELWACEQKLRMNEFLVNAMNDHSSKA